LTRSDEKFCSTILAITDLAITDKKRLLGLRRKKKQQLLAITDP